MPGIFDKKVGANVLPTAITVAMLMALAVLAVLSVWEMEGFMFARTTFRKARRADIESAFNLYMSHSEIIGEDGHAGMQLYDSLSASSVTLEKRSWGLYEVVAAYSPAARMSQTRMLGSAGSAPGGMAFYYPDAGNSLTLTGRSNVKGRISLPRSGIIYGQMKSVFFEGERIDPGNIKTSAAELPEPDPVAVGELESLFEMLGYDYPAPDSDSIAVRFYGEETAIHTSWERLSDCSMSGNVILLANRLNIEASTSLNDIIVVCRSATIEEGFTGSVQIFASDSVTVCRNAVLQYPSGIYSGKYTELQDSTVVNGYVIVVPEEKTDIMKPHYRQSRLAKVRGLLYVDGFAQLQGIVTGTAYLHKAVYYSPQGYYKDMLYDVSILPNAGMALPFWLNGSDKRKEMKWER